MRQGEIEVMIHRRLLVDDGRGVGEPLNETDIDHKGLRQSFRHYVLFEGNYRALQKLNDQRILPFFAASSLNTFANVNIRKVPISVPESVKLYLRPFEDGSYLLRFHNINPKDKVTLIITQVSFVFPDPWTMSEQTLAANQLLAEWKKKQYAWNVDNAEVKPVLKNLLQTITKYFKDLG